MHQWGMKGTLEGKFYYPRAIAIHAGSVFISDTYNYRIQVFSLRGHFLRSWKIDFKIWGMTIWQKFLYVSDWNHHQIHQYSLDGIHLQTLGGPGLDAGKFNCPHSLAIDESGIYVTDFLNHRIQVFSHQGKWIKMWGCEGENHGEFKGPRGIVVKDNYLYVMDSLNNRVQVFTKDGQFIDQCGEEGNKDGQFRHPHGCVLSETGSLYIVDCWNHRIQVFE